MKRQKRLRHLAVDNGQPTIIDLPLEFEGKRAFVVWDHVVLGRHEFKARIEINPKLLQKGAGLDCAYSYRGDLVLPRPQDN